jgi:hypothetical protein
MRLYNRVRVNTATTGTGTVTLGAAFSNAFRTFAEAGAASGDVVTYVLEEGNDFEIGRGTYVSSGTTLSRDTVLISKIGGTAGTTRMTLAGGATVRIDAAAEDFLRHGECQLTKSATNILLSPKNGNRLIVNGVPCVVPDAGVTLAPTGLTAGTLYFIYATASGGIVNALEASTTGHATQAGTGVEIKSGDATRTLVGMARPITGPAWQDAAQQRFVVSYFNRRNIGLVGNFSTGRTTTATTFAEINSEIRCEALVWGDEAVHVDSTLAAVFGLTSSTGYMSIAFDGVTPEPATLTLLGTSVPSAPFINGSPTVHKTGLTEGYHYATVVGQISSGDTLTILGASGGVQRGTLIAGIRG